MKQRIQGIIIGVLVTVLVFGSITTVWAAAASKKIDVYYDNYKIYVDGVLFEGKDKNGVIEPFSYNGWIYAPFEHIAKALGKSVSWDDKTKSLYIGQKTPAGAATSFLETVPPYDISSKTSVKIEKSVTMGGTQYNSALTFDANNNYSLHNLDGKYKRIVGYIGRIDGTNMNSGTFSFYGDGKLIASYEMKPDDLPKQISIDVIGVTQLKIEYKCSLWTTYAFADATIE